MQHFCDQIAGAHHVGGFQTEQTGAGTEHADQLGGDGGGHLEIAGNPAGRLAELLDLGSTTTHGDDHQLVGLGWRTKEALVDIPVRNQAERTRAAKNAGQLDVAASKRCKEGVSRFVDCNAALLLGVVADVVGKADFGDHLGVDDVLKAHLVPTSAKCEHQRFVE